MSRLTQATRLLGLLTFWLVLTDGLININLLEPFVSRHLAPPLPSLSRPPPQHAHILVSFFFLPLLYLSSPLHSALLSSSRAQADTCHARSDDSGGGVVETPDVEKLDASLRARGHPLFPGSLERSSITLAQKPQKKTTPTTERFPWQRPSAHFTTVTTATHPSESMLSTSASTEQSRAASPASRSQPDGAKQEAAGALPGHRRLLHEPTATAASPSSCPKQASGTIKLSVTTWTSLPSEDLVRVGAVDVSTSGGPAAPREMYVSLENTNTSAEAPVSLKGVTVAFEFSRTVVVIENTGATEVADPSQLVFTCWGAQLMPTTADGSDGGHHAVPCSQQTLDIDAIGPRVTFGDVLLQPGEFLVGGYSNFRFIWTAGIIDTSAYGSGSGVVPTPAPPPSQTPQATPVADVVTVPAPFPTSAPTPTPTVDPPPLPSPTPQATPAADVVTVPAPSPTSAPTLTPTVDPPPSTTPQATPAADVVTVPSPKP